MTQPEIDFLLLLAQTPFLPVGRALGEETPIFENDPSKTPVLEVLEKKSLISIDYRSPFPNRSRPSTPNLFLQPRASCARNPIPKESALCHRISPGRLPRRR